MKTEIVRNCNLAPNYATIRILESHWHIYLCACISKCGPCAMVNLPRNWQKQPITRSSYANNASSSNNGSHFVTSFWTKAWGGGWEKVCRGRGGVLLLYSFGAGSLLAILDYMPWLVGCHIFPVAFLSLTRWFMGDTCVPVCENITQLSTLTNAFSLYPYNLLIKRSKSWIILSRSNFKTYSMKKGIYLIQVK